MGDVADEEPCPLYYLNVFNLPFEVDETDIRNYYKDIPLQNVHRSSKGAVDLEFNSKADLVAAIDRGTASFNGTPFYIRTSYFLTRSMRQGFKGSRGKPSRYGGSQAGYRYPRVIQ